MFVNATLLGSLDRLHVRSMLTSATGSILGVLGTIAFFILCFILFLGPVRIFFEGDYIQSSFNTYDLLEYDMSVGCDFRMAISFFHKDTGKVANHTHVKDFLDVQLYRAQTFSVKISDVGDCRQDYFAGAEGDPYLGSNECFIATQNLEFSFNYNFGYSSLFGFHLNAQCSDPFTCTYRSQYSQQIKERIVNFFDSHYYILYFTSKVFDDYGRSKDIVHRVFSSELDIHEQYQPVIYPIMFTRKVFMDDTIMPWYNNYTYNLMSWDGKLNPSIVDQQLINSFSLGGFLVHEPRVQIVYRYYNKLDWLLGLLGGGIFLLFLIFWVPCNYINTIKSKIRTCEELTIQKQKDQPLNLLSLKKTHIPFSYYLTHLFPFCGKKTHTKIAYSEKLLDIASLVKKQKVTIKNLTENGRKTPFEPRQLNFQGESEKMDEKDAQVEKLQLHQNSIKLLQQSTTLNAYQNNPVGLAVCGGDIASKKIIENEQYQQYSKMDNTLHQPSERLKNFFKFFDVFGAKPMLSGSPHHASIFSWIMTCLIIILAILAFALTLHNMNITKTYLDETFIESEDLKVDLVTNENLKMAFCINRFAFEYNYIVGPDRIADVKFFQAVRNGTNTQFTYHSAKWMKDENTNYFQSTQQLQYPTQYCFRMNHNLHLEISGSHTTQNEAFVGFILEPYCGTPSCTVNATQFYSFLNNFYTAVLLPENKFDPNQGRIVSKWISKQLNPQLQLSVLENSIVETIYTRVIHLEDDRSNWIVGGKPELLQQTITLDREHLNSLIKSNVGVPPYYRIDLRSNGEVQRVVFTNYKVDFLFATIGGCFIFFFMILCCFGKLFNVNQVRRKLAEQLYTQKSSSLYCCAWLFSRICCCCSGCQMRRKIQQKIDQDLDILGMVKKVDTSYRLSSAFYPNLQHKNASLVYLRKILNSDEQIVLEDEKEKKKEDEDYIEFQSDFQSEFNGPPEPKKKPDPLHSDGQLKSKDELEQCLGETIPEFKEIEIQRTWEDQQSHQRKSKFEKILGKLDLFSNKTELTFQGKRTVQSVCGGITCILMLIFIILLTQHFLTIYFSDEHSVSYQTLNSDQVNNRQLELVAGDSFKFILSFFTPSFFHFHNISQVASDIELTVKQIKYQRKNGGVVRSETSTSLIPCPGDYLDEHQGGYTDSSTFDNIGLGYCIPDGTVLRVYGIPEDEVSEHFLISIHAKEGQGQKISDFLREFIPRYHISVPKKNFKDPSYIQYETLTFIRNYEVLDTFGIHVNMSLTKIMVQYDTAVNPANEFPEVNLFDYDYNVGNELAFATDVDLSYNISFNSQDYIRQYTVKKVKANQLFGLVGGAILFLFFGIGAFVRSFNEYRLRYLIGCELYQIRPETRPTIKYKREFGKTITREDHIRMGKEKIYQKIINQNRFGEPQLLLAWFLSLIGFIRRNYNFSDTLRLASLIESRASEDINLYNFYKDMYACEADLKNSKLFGSAHQHINFSRIYMKHLLRDIYEELEIDNSLDYAARENNLSDWEIKAIIQAKHKHINGEQLFKEKWLDQYFGIQRKQTTSSERKDMLEEKIEEDFLDSGEEIKRKYVT